MRIYDLATNKPRRIAKCIYYNILKRKRLKQIRRDKKQYISLCKNENLKYNKKYKWICIESLTESGLLDCYYWQDMWAAKKIIERKPDVHYDIGSRIDGFIGHLQASEQKTVLIDVRPLPYKLDYVDFIQEDATMLSCIADESLESISALCSLEHFGLGRYGDSVDPDACFKAMKSIQRVLKKGGIAYIAVPIGKEHLEFNAHRIFYPETIINTFSDMKLLEFYVTTLENPVHIKKVENIHEFDNEMDNHGDRFGMFEFEKIDEYKKKC